MKKNPYQRKIAEILGTRPIVFNPDLARALKSAKAGLLLNQLLYWWDKGDDPNWIYKTTKEIENETALTRKEQETAIKICKSKGVLEVKVRGVPATRHFKLNIQKIEELIMRNNLSLYERGKPVCTKGANQFVRKGQTITEMTTEMTTNTSLKDKEKQGKALQSSDEKETIKIRGEAQLQGCLIRPVINPVANISSVNENGQRPNSYENYGNSDINEVTTFLKEKLGGSPDGSQKDNRRFAFLLFNKLKKDYPDEEPKELIKTLIEFGLKDDFHAKNITSFKYLYYNTQKIVQSIKGQIKNPKYIRL